MKHVLPMLSSPVHGICLPPSTRILRSKSGLGVKGAHAGGGAGFGGGAYGEELAGLAVEPKTSLDWRKPLIVGSIVAVAAIALMRR